MDATAAITASLQTMAVQQAKLMMLAVTNGSQPKAIADGTGQVVWQADTYTPSSGAAPEASVQAYAPGRGASS